MNGNVHGSTLGRARGKGTRQGRARGQGTGAGHAGRARGQGTGAGHGGSELANAGGRALGARPYTARPCARPYALLKDDVEVLAGLDEA